MWDISAASDYHAVGFHSSARLELHKITLGLPPREEALILGLNAKRLIALGPRAFAATRDG